MLYPRPQLRLLLLLATALLFGLLVREWRAGFPEQAERLDRFDRDEPPAPLPPVPFSPTHGRRTRTGGEEVWPGAGAPPERRRGERASETDPRAAQDDRRPLDLNAASGEALARLPGIGQGLARRILEERERNGGFDSLDALRRVLGMGPKKLAAIRHLLTVSAGGDSVEARAAGAAIGPSTEAGAPERLGTHARPEDVDAAPDLDETQTDNEHLDGGHEPHDDDARELPDDPPER